MAIILFLPEPDKALSHQVVFAGIRNKRRAESVPLSGKPEYAASRNAECHDKTAEFQRFPEDWGSFRMLHFSPICLSLCMRTT